VAPGLGDRLRIARIGVTPVPGSVVSTRSSRRAASGVPSATTTMPAWIE
jgi:hypothetical protein